MTKNLESKCKLCRRAGEKLFLKADRCVSPKCAIVRKPYPPGIHGKTAGKGRGRGGASEYGKQLSQKQEMKRIYGVSESQFKKHILEAQTRKGVIGDNIIGRLELRFDNVVYRLGFAGSRTQARQLVGHAMFKVNSKDLNIPSAEIKVGDEIEIKQEKLSNKYFSELKSILKKNPKTPEWLSLDPGSLKAKVLSRPVAAEAGINVDAQMVIEFYSR